MLTPFSIDPSRISTLPAHIFTRFCNDLIRAEASRIALPQSFVDDTVRETVTDGGVDIRVREPDEDLPISWGNWLPAGSSAWQYKSGACPSANKLANEEFGKPEVEKAMQRGDSYVFLTADSINARKKKQIRHKINGLYRKHDQLPKGEVYAATDLAKWAQQHLGPAAWYLGGQAEGWPYDQWRANPNFRNEFFPDEARADLIREIRRRIRDGDLSITVFGRAGLGKTRAVLEAVSEDGIKQRVLYVPDAASLNPQSFWQLRNDIPEASGVLVIDECTASEYQRLKVHVDGLPVGMVTILIGPSEYPVRGDFELPALSVEELAKVVGDFAPGLIESQRQAIAARCGGSPKLVVYVSEEIARGEVKITSWEDIERAQDVATFIVEKLFPFRNQDPESKVMRGLCLFTRLGWRDEVEIEGQVATKFFEVGWREAQLAAERLIERGIVSRRGRYLYPTPDILANYLTRNTIRSMGGTSLNELFGGMHEGAQRSIIERLRQLGDDPGMRESVIEIVGDPSFFRRPEDLNDTSRTHFLRLLAPVFPDVALDALDRTLGSASREELLNFADGGRREVVWMLEELAWWREYFDRAAKLLLRLAWAENETYANNATGIWSQLFQVWLGGTAAPYNQRLALLKEMLNDPEPALRKLGLVGLGSALQTRSMTRIGGSPEDTGQLPPEEWRPRDGVEWNDIIFACLAELERLLDDPDESVRREAMSVLWEQGSDLIEGGFLERWASLIGHLTGEPFEVRKELLDVVVWHLSHGNPSAEDRATLERLEGELSGASFSDRLRRVVGSWDYELESSGRDGGQEAVRELATYSLQNVNQLEAELPWLFSGDANSGFAFGKELGRNDIDETVLPMLLRNWKSEASDDRILTGYLAGAKEERGTEWLEKKLDDWVADLEKSMLVATTIWRVLPTSRAAERLIRLMQNGSVPPTFLGHLVWGFWARDLRPEEVRELVAIASSDKSNAAVFARLAFLDQYLKERPEGMEQLREATEEVLKESTNHRFGTMDGYHWRQLAENTFADDPLAMARLGVLVAEKIAKSGSLLGDKESRQVLLTAISEADTTEQAKILEEVLGPAIEGAPALLWILDDPLERDLLDQFDPETVVEWVKQDVEKRLPLIVHAIPVRGQPLASLARAMLVRYGDRDNVRSALSATFGSGVWVGSEAEWVAGKARQVEEWTKDQDPNVRRWALELKQAYRKMLDRARLLEEEEDDR